MNAVASIVITLTDQGQVAVSGNIDNKLAALGLIEVGKQAVIDMHRKNEEGGGRIITPPAGAFIPKT